MAQRHHSLDMSELKDVIELMRGFEEHNTVKLAFALSVMEEGKSPVLAVTVSAYQRGVLSAEPVPLASVLLTTLGMNQKTVLGVLTHALYALDFRLALNEFGSGEKQA